ncbi:MAG: hypothetical protein IM337_07420 [Microcystis sp. M110S1]|uniref:hypothetical protein n=1 Tax=Microcystis sp. M110S1 TaxID=2771102 RepID=UPI00258E3C87|nr:hypothetical protein [Microcystis sp. M110S1]MCA2973832.1 hypothetical protein [Microcystis sp. M110S1]
MTFATTTATPGHVIRSQVWSSQLKEVFEDDLMALKYVEFLTGFPDGDQFNIASMGQMQTNDYAEGQAVKYSGFDTGQFTLTITDYKSIATQITKRMLQDSFLASQIQGQFVPKMRRALDKTMETDILALGPEAQTTGNLNQINGADHRWIGSAANETMGIDDFARASYALRKAEVPMNNLVAIVDPSVAFALETATNLVNVSNNPRWEGIIRDGMTTGMQFRMNVYGWDVYISNNLKPIGAETIDGKTTATGVANLFFSADQAARPFVGAVRQAPTVESEYNKDYQREEYVMTTRYGLKLYRPENMVVVITDTDQV